MQRAKLTNARIFYKVLLSRSSLELIKMPALAPLNPIKKIPTLHNKMFTSNRKQPMYFCQ
jgi:hypothetical protein